jgi:CheY-like chemotaxis protein
VETVALDPRPKFLLIGPPPPHLNGSVAAADVEAVAADPAEVAGKLASGQFAAVLADPDVVAGLLDRFRRDELIVGNIDKGLAVLDPLGTVTWANAAFRSYSGDDALGKPFLEALGEARVAAPDADPLAPARRGSPVSLRLHRSDKPNQPYFEADVRPVVAPDGGVARLIAMVRNITPEVVQQQKLDALHAAGRELAGLDAAYLQEMKQPERVELLKLNLRRYIRDLLRYDTIEVRLLDRNTNELKPLLEDGMLAEARDRKLFAAAEGQGVTGHVAFTGKSYLCPDTANDKLYIRGAEGARSSMTVPLTFQGEVLGTLNVESPRVNAFGEDDLQFTELFSREVATALHTLDLLSAERGCTASESIDAVNREIALPIDDVLACAGVLLQTATDAEAVLLRRILGSVRQVKDSVTKVGRELAQDATLTRGSGRLVLAGRRVLVVEPDEQFRRQAHLLLARLGAAAETAGTATEGLAMAAAARYDAIFAAQKQADMGGTDCYRRFMAENPRSSLAVTVGFEYDGAHVLVNARADGVKHILFKQPFSDDAVIAAALDGPPTKPA